MKFLKNMVLVVAIIIIASTFTNGVAQVHQGDDDISEEEGQMQWWANWNRDTNHNNIDDIIEEKTEDERIGIFINYDHHPDEKDVAKLSKFDLKIKYVYKYIDVICARNVVVKDVEGITHLPHVVMVKLEPQVRPSLDISARAIKVRESVDYSPNTAADLGYTGEGTGAGIGIAILDTGVDDLGRSPSQRHESLDDLDDDPASSDPKFIAGVDFTQEESFFTLRDGTYNPDDTNGHGTHCAGIAMGTGGSEAIFRGMAPLARLVDVRVMENIGRGNAGEIIEGIEWCIEHQSEFNIRVLSLSIGSFENSDGSEETSQVVNRAVDSGLVVVAAMGNDGENFVPHWAAADKAIAVGSVDDMGTISRNDDSLSSFSNYGPRLDDGDDDELDELKPDVVAYGDGIESAQANTQSGYNTKSGTSMATPHVAGVVALMLHANPNLPPEKVKEILRESAEARGSPSYPQLDPKYNTKYGWGIVDAYKAVSLAEGFVEVNINIDSPTMDDTVSGTVEISGTASTDKGPVSVVEVSIDDPNFNTYVIRADDTDTWSITWDTTTWENSFHTIYARATRGEYSALAEVDVFVLNQGGGTGDGGGDTGPPTVDLMGIGKISVYALAAFIGIIAGVVALIVAGILHKRKKTYREMMVTMQQEQKSKEGY